MRSSRDLYYLLRDGLYKRDKRGTMQVSASAHEIEKNKMQTSSTT